MGKARLENPDICKNCTLDICLNLIVCEKCRKYGNTTMMSKREIDLNTIRIKVKIGRIPLIPTFVYLSYNYFECPICHWFKFVKKPIKEII